MMTFIEHTNLCPDIGIGSEPLLDFLEPYDIIVVDRGYVEWASKYFENIVRCLIVIALLIKIEGGVATSFEFVVSPKLMAIFIFLPYVEQIFFRKKIQRRNFATFYKNIMRHLTSAL